MSKESRRRQRAANPSTTAGAGPSSAPGATGNRVEQLSAEHQSERHRPCRPARSWPHRLPRNVIPRAAAHPAARSRCRRGRRRGRDRDLRRIDAARLCLLHGLVSGSDRHATEQCGTPARVRTARHGQRARLQRHGDHVHLLPACLGSPLRRRRRPGRSRRGSTVRPMTCGRRAGSTTWSTAR